MVPFDFNRQQGDWTIIGMKMPDGGFACSMSRLVDAQAFTLVTGLRANPVVMHQTLFAPTSIPEGTVVSVLVMLPSGLASPAFPVTVRSSSPLDASTPESQANGRPSHLIVSIDKETLKGIGIILGVEGTLSLRVIGQDGTEMERLRFPLGGGMEAALLHADCVSSLYATMHVSGQTPMPRPAPMTR